MTTIVMTGICLAGIAFMLRFLLALSRETRRPANHVVHVITESQNLGLVPSGRAALKIQPAFYHGVPPSAAGAEVQRFAVRQR